MQRARSGAIVGEEGQEAERGEARYERRRAEPARREDERAAEGRAAHSKISSNESALTAFLSTGPRN